MSNVIPGINHNNRPSGDQGGYVDGPRVRFYQRIFVRDQSMNDIYHNMLI